MDEKTNVSFSAKYRIALGLICFAFGIIGVLTVDTAYEEVRKSVPIENISAAFHYVADNQTVRPADIMNQEQLKALISKVPIEI